VSQGYFSGFCMAPQDGMRADDENAQITVALPGDWTELLPPVESAAVYGPASRSGRVKRG